MLKDYQNKLEQNLKEQSELKKEIARLQGKMRTRKKNEKILKEQIEILGGGQKTLF